MLKTKNAKITGSFQVIYTNMGIFSEDTIALIKDDYTRNKENDKHKNRNYSELNYSIFS